MAISDHKQGGGVAAALRKSLGGVAEQKRRGTVVADLSDNPKAMAVKKRITPTPPRSPEFAAALEQYRHQLEQPGSTPVGDVPAIQVRIEQAVADSINTKPDVPNQPTRTGPTASKRPAVNQDHVPKDDRNTTSSVVRKAAETLVEKTSAETVDAKALADPIRTLSAALAKLLDVFRASEGRDPGLDDATYWQAYGRVLSAFAAKVKRDDKAAT